MDTQPSSPTRVAEVPAADGSRGDGSLARALTGFWRGFIDLRTMPLPLRGATLSGFALLGGVAAALALSDLPQPRVATPFQLDGQTTQTTLLAAIVIVVVGAIAFAFALAGAMSLRWLPRLVVVAIVTGALFAVPQLNFLPGSTTSDPALFVSLIVVPVVQFALLGGLWLWALGVSLARRRRARLGAAAGTAPARPTSGALGPSLVFVLVFFGLDLVSWALAHATGGALGRVADELLLSDLAAPVASFALIAPVFVYWFSTDSTEWGTTLAAGFARATGRVAWLMPALTAAAAVAIGANAVRLAGAQIIPPLVAAAAVAGLAALLVMVGPPPARWPDGVPIAALVAGALALYAVVDLPIVVVGFLAGAHVFSVGAVPALTGGMTALDTLVAIFLGLALAAWGRLRGSGRFASAGLTLALVASVVFIANVGAIEGALGITWVPQPKHIQAGIEIVVALATLGLLAGLMLHRRPPAAMTAALIGPFVALTGLQVIDWYRDFAADRANASPGSITLLAAFFLASQVWDVARSGGPITNGGSPAAPRASRVLVYFGYTLLTAALFLYASSLRVTATGAAVPQSLLGVSDLDFILALATLCLPLALVTGFTRFQRWRAATAVAAATPVRLGRARLLFGGTVGAGAALTALSGILILAHVAQAARPQPTTYMTPTPGPSCDPRGATWPVLPSLVTHCRADGLYVTVPGSQLAYVGFRPPAGYGTSDYRVSVRLDLGRAPGTTPGCAGLVTRFSAIGYYDGIVCSTGDWALRHIDGQSGTVTVLAQASIPAAQTYTLSMTAQGMTEMLALDGRPVASRTDAGVAAGDVELEVVNVTTDAETVAFSDFTYTPLE